MALRLISVKIPEKYLEGLDILVKVKKMYPNRSEAIRVAIRDLLIRELPNLIRTPNKVERKSIIEMIEALKGEQ